MVPSFEGPKNLDSTNENRVDSNKASSKPRQTKEEIAEWQRHVLEVANGEFSMEKGFVPASPEQLKKDYEERIKTAERDRDAATTDEQKKYYSGIVARLNKKLGRGQEPISVSALDKPAENSNVEQSETVSVGKQIESTIAEIKNFNRNFTPQHPEIQGHVRELTNFEKGLTDLNQTDLQKINIRKNIERVQSEYLKALQVFLGKLKEKSVSSESEIEDQLEAAKAENGEKMSEARQKEFKTISDMPAFEAVYLSKKVTKEMIAGNDELEKLKIMLTVNIDEPDAKNESRAKEFLRKVWVHQNESVELKKAA